MSSNPAQPLPGQQVIHVAKDPDTDLEALFNAVLNPRPSSWRKKHLPESFFKEPDSGSHSRQSSTDSGSQQPPRLPPQHVRSHSSPASLQLRPGALAAAAVTSSPAQHAHSRHQSFDVTDELPLPPGWEMAYTSTGQKYFLNHVEKITTWQDPRKTMAASMNQMSLHAQATNNNGGVPGRSMALSQPNLVKMQADLEFSSRRSPVICLNGCVASSQPLASNIGLEILKRGGNAADAAVAVAAALNVTEPTSTGLGGDAFCLFYDAATKQVRGLNGSGRSPKALTLDLMRRCGFSQSNPPSKFHAFNVTVPGAAACWCDTVTLFGSKKLSLADLLQPAIDLAQNGFPVAEITAYHWADGIKSLRAAGRELGADLLINNQPPKHGQIMTNHNLAHTFQELVLHGRNGFYEGKIAQAVVDVVQENGGVMSLDDMKNHVTTEITPIYTDYKAVRVWEVPPNSQGMAALIALNILENFSIKDQGHNSAEYLHILAESLKLSLTDTMHFSTDPEKVKVPVEGLLSKDYAFQRAHFIQMDKARSVCEPGIPTGSDTVYFTVVDREGNGCSFVNSNYMGFGTGLVPPNCGFSLQNRGANFSLDSNHVNCIGSEKRPYHTIIPAMLTDPVSGSLLCSFGVMGGFMQPQGHVQVLLNMIEFGMNPQRALDAPRLFVQYDQTAKEWELNLEAGLDQNVADKLRERGHVVKWPVEGHERNQFGRGQIISKGKWWWDSNNEKKERDERVLWAGSDPRADGCAVGY